MQLRGLSWGLGSQVLAAFCAAASAFVAYTFGSDRFASRYFTLLAIVSIAAAIGAWGAAASASPATFATTLAMPLR